MCYFLGTCPSLRGDGSPGRNEDSGGRGGTAWTAVRTTVSQAAAERSRESHAVIKAAPGAKNAPRQPGGGRLISRLIARLLGSTEGRGLHAAEERWG